MTKWRDIRTSDGRGILVVAWLQTLYHSSSDVLIVGTEDSLLVDIGLLGVRLISDSTVSNSPDFQSISTAPTATEMLMSQRREPHRKRMVCLFLGPVGFLHFSSMAAELLGFSLDAVVVDVDWTSGEVGEDEEERNG